jgi:oxygen-dependent protoporphyrinogen oxidase
MTSAAPVIVVGAGISGLVCAYTLLNAGIDVQVVEASRHAGGMIRSEQRDGFLLELGPQSFSGTGPLRALCDQLAITDQLVQAPSHAPRYVLIDGVLKTVPLSPPAMLASSLLSMKTKWRIARDAFGASAAPDEDESIASFVRRKFGNELLDRLVGPFVSGIYAGDPECLSLRSAFPHIHEAEQSAGSVIRGLRLTAKASKGRRERPALLSFRAGNETLVRALTTKMAARLVLETEVVAIAVNRESGAGEFQLRVRQAGLERSIAASQLIVAAPADVAGALLRDMQATFEPVLSGIEYAPVAVISLGYRREDVGHSLEGFGFLAPRSSGLRVLGCVWNTSLFPQRAPAGHVLLTTFIGGATDPHAAALSAEELASLVHRELAPLLKIRAAAILSNIHIYRRALPQYNIGHRERLLALDKLRAEFPGLFFVGNYLLGPAIGNCIESAMVAAADVITRSKAAGPPARQGS